MPHSALATTISASNMRTSVIARTLWRPQVYSNQMQTVVWPALPMTTNSAVSLQLQNVPSNLLIIWIGAGSRLSLFLKNNTAISSQSSSPSSSTAKSSSVSVPLGPSVTPVAGAYTSLGCYSDNDVTQRTLTGAAFPDTGQTIELCAANCKKFAYFGLEYGVECYVSASEFLSVEDLPKLTTSSAELQLLILVPSPQMEGAT